MWVILDLYIVISSVFIG